MDIRGILLLYLLHFVQSKVVDLSCRQIKEFVDGHNSRRLKLANGEVPKQPAASEMKYMIWDEELASKATKWASQHTFSHNPDNSIGSGRFSTGENIYKASSSNLDWKLNVDKALLSWFEEHKYYKYGPLKSSDFNSRNAIGHYTQMVWSNSVYLGCGMSERVSNGMKEYLVVCNYGPAGNYIDHTPYKANGPGSGELLCTVDDCSEPYGDTCYNY